MENLTNKLVDEFCSLLDEVVILSICSDRNLKNPKELEDARNVLLILSKDVETEELSGFNPSGLGEHSVVNITDSDTNEADEVRIGLESDLKSNDGLTSTTESSGLQSHTSAASSKASTSDSPNIFHVDVFDGLTTDDKEHQILEMFPFLKPIDIKLALKKAKGDASLAIDELLNIEWLEETGHRMKGIDGFYTPNDDVSGKRKKGKKNKKAAVRTPESQDISAATPAEEQQNDEQKKEAIAYLAERLNQTESDISRIYQRRGGSIGATIVEILENYLDLGLHSSDRAAFMFPGAEESVKKYPWIPNKYIISVFEITSLTRDYALDLIQSLADYYEKPAYLKYDVSYSVKASNSYDTVLEDGFTTKATPRGGGVSKATGARTLTLAQPASLQSAAKITAGLSASRNQSFITAQSAFAKGRSDPLFRQVGGYYAQRAREQAHLHRQARSIEAAYQVELTSTSDSADLHGLTVEDGVNVAISQVWKWWNNLGEDRARKVRDGFNVITGRGRHNVSGSSPLRHNVIKALLADGWKGEVLSAGYLVTGRRR